MIIMRIEIIEIIVAFALHVGIYPLAAQPAQRFNYFKIIQYNRI